MPQENQDFKDNTGVNVPETTQNETDKNRIYTQPYQVPDFKRALEYPINDPAFTQAYGDVKGFLHNLSVIRLQNIPLVYTSPLSMARFKQINFDDSINKYIQTYSPSMTLEQTIDTTTNSLVFVPVGNMGTKTFVIGSSTGDVVAVTIQLTASWLNNSGGAKTTTFIVRVTGAVTFDKGFAVTVGANDFASGTYSRTFLASSPGTINIQPMWMTSGAGGTQEIKATTNPTQEHCALICKRVGLFIAP